MFKKGECLLWIYGKYLLFSGLVLLYWKYLETMKSITAGQNNKVVYMPYEATGILSSVDGIKQMLNK